MKTLLLLSAILTSGCALDILVDLFDPNANTWFVNRRLLDPIPGEYRSWYSEVETCLLERGSGDPFYPVTLGTFPSIIWWVADNILVDGVEVGGVLSFPHTITIRTSRVNDTFLVRHEMVHHVLQLGDVLHGTDVFDCAFL